MKKIQKLFAILPLVALISASRVFGADSLTLCGSDLLAPIIGNEVVKLAAENGIKVDVDMKGSFGALQKMKADKCDIAIVAVPKNSPKLSDYILIPFAYQAAIVVVNVVNPLEEISTRQLFDIFSKNAPDHTETWAQLGVKNIGLRNILPLITSFSDNVVVELFKYTALNGTNLGTWVNVAGNKQNIYNMIKVNNSAIGVVGKFSPDSMLKVVAISNSGASENTRTYAFRPDIDSIYNGDYPLVLDFYIACRKNAVQKIKPLAAILLSDVIANKINSSDFFAAPQNSRKKSILELDMAR